MASQVDNRAAPGTLLKGDKPKRRRSDLPRMNARGARNAPGQRQPTVEDPRHLAAIRQCPCIVCAPVCDVQAEAAHIRASTMEHNKPYTGIGRKPDDRWSLPLCASHHRTGKSAQHKFAELPWWASQGIDPFAAALALYQASPNVEAMRVVILTRAWTSPTNSAPGSLKSMP